MLKKVLKGLFVVVGLLVGMVVSLVLILDWKEEWLYEKFGKEKVLNFMKKFEPYIIMEPDKFKEVEEEESEPSVVEEKVEEVAKGVAENLADKVVEEVMDEVISDDDEEKQE